MTGPRPTPPNGHPLRPRPDPLSMTPGEKVAAEWEARHDARARGTQGNPAAVHEYLQHARSEERQHPAPAHPHGTAPAPGARPPRAPSSAEQTQPSPLRAKAPGTSWLRRLFRRSGT